MSKALMIQGTGSGAGKSLVAAAFCRIFRDMGLKVVPFKAQNMALNSFITGEGGEIGRAQALQAEACGIEPSVHMNPVLLKASGEAGSQVILQGRVHSTMKARDYYAFRNEAWETVINSFEKISKEYEVVVIEGAGSPAEINLMDVDIVNMAVARYANAPVILVGDIDKGGVFASLYGTVKLLGADSRYIKAFLINKFRGDIEILRPGLEMIRKETGIRVAGVLPYIKNLDLPEEDGLALSRRPADPYPRSSEGKTIKIVILRLHYISNFTDFDPFMHEPDVEISYSRNPADVENADLVILPGTKNTVKDLLALKEEGLDSSIRRAFKKGSGVIGICGGYQMLGKKIFDPSGVESPHREVEGIGLLNIETTFGKEKRTCRVEAETAGLGNWPFRNAGGLGTSGGIPRLKGYEIHMGESTGEIGLFKVRRISLQSAMAPSPGSPFFDGSKKDNCWGTYIHGVFDNDLFRRAIIDDMRHQKGMAALGRICSYSEIKEKAIDRLSDVVRENTDMDFIRGLLDL